MSQPAIPFLHKLAAEVISWQIPLHEICILFPNRRAEVFFKQHLATQAGAPILSPLMLTAEDFVAEVTGIETLSGNALLFEAYKQYLGLNLKTHESFEDFLKWANTALYDFNEIDRYLVVADDLFDNMVSAKAIERWGVTDERSELIDRYLETWRTFKPLYHKMWQHCLANNTGWQGLAFRQAADHLNLVDEFVEKRKIKRMIFAGFNALNQAETVIIKHLLEGDKTHIFWDADAWYLDHTNQEAGMFIRGHQQRWARYKNSVIWKSEQMLKDKEITVYGAGGAVEQAKKVGEILSTFDIEKSTRTAVVLAEETLLMPVLNSIPKDFNAINVTMGMSLKLANPGVLVLTVLKVKQKLQNQKRVYYKDLERILSFEVYAWLFAKNNTGTTADAFITKVKSQNMVYISEDDFDWLENYFEVDLSTLRFLFKEQTAFELLQYLANTLEAFVGEELKNSVEKEIYYGVITAVRSLLNDLQTSEVEIDYNIAVELFRNALSSEQVSFYGEPLMGLQIMGILETRTLDFENLIITSVNEGVLPAGKSNNSFIPYDIRRFFKMPVHNERDAIYAYHFFRLLQKAKNIHLIYNNVTTGIGGKEKSRFIRQMQAEWKNHGVTITEAESSITIKDESLELFTEIKKSDSLRLAIKKYLEKGVSPTALAEYINNPLQFYFNRILNVREEEEIEEVVGHATLGSVIHDVLEKLYTPFVGSFPAAADFKMMREKLVTLLADTFEEYYKRGQMEEGKNLLIFQVAQTMIKNFLKKDQAYAEGLQTSGTPLKIISLEERLEKTVYVKEIDTHVKFVGKADRIEKVGNDVIIVDYKTGMVDERQLVIKELEDLFDPEKEKTKVLQLLLYAYMYKDQVKNGNVFAAVFSLRKWSQGTIRTKMYNAEKKKETLIFNPQVEAEFEELLLLKICEMQIDNQYFKDINVISLAQD